MPQHQEERRTPKDAPLTNNQNSRSLRRSSRLGGRFRLATLFHLLLQLFTTLRTSLSALLRLLAQLLLSAQQLNVRHLRRIALPRVPCAQCASNHPDAIHNAAPQC